FSTTTPITDREEQGMGKAQTIRLATALTVIGIGVPLTVIANSRATSAGTNLSGAAAQVGTQAGSATGTTKAATAGTTSSGTTASFPAPRAPATTATWSSATRPTAAPPRASPPIPTRASRPTSRPSMPTPSTGWR